ncbi:hypothetical protein CFP56_011164 [Quercus suber]|uniref:Secreted protein n=1 Tax=Quercus suber TaxID=58331 RepID=A0AAW0KYD6_QUESU
MLIVSTISRMVFAHLVIIAVCSLFVNGPSLIPFSSSMQTPAVIFSSSAQSGFPTSGEPPSVSAVCLNADAVALFDA